MTSLWVVLLAGGVVGIATVALLPQITAIPRERWTLATLRPVFAQAAVGGLLPGLVAIAFRAPPEWALGIALAGGVVVNARLTQRYAPIRAVKRLTAALHDESRRKDAILRIGPALDRARPTNGDAGALSSWAQAGLIGAAYLIDADETEAARGILDRMRGLTFRGVSQANHALLWAHVEIFAQDMIAVRSALESVKRPIALPLLDAHCEALEALALACEGDDVRALARVDAWTHAAGQYDKLRLTTRIVAYACRSDDDARGRSEAELGRRYGQRALSAARKLAER